MQNVSMNKFYKRDVKNFYAKPLTPTEFFYLGVPMSNLGQVETLEDLRRNPSNIVTCECVKSVTYTQNEFKIQKLIKKEKYVMGIGVYITLHHDVRSNIGILKPTEPQFKKIYRPYLGQDLTDKTILIFRQGGIGDLLFIQPNLIYLKEKYPTCTINLACGPQYQDMVKEWDCVDNVIDLPFTLREMFKANYHVTFEGVIERCKEAEEICSYNLFTKWMGLNLPDELLIPKQKPKEEATNSNLEILNNINVESKNFIILQMTASSIIRTPHQNVWKKIVNLLVDKGHTILITDNPRKAKDVDLFIEQLKLPEEKKHQVQNYAQYSKTIAETISLVSLSKLVIATDSALPHIAESLGVKSFSIMGPFPGKIRYSTYKHNDWIDVKANTECGPCFLHGMQPCKNSSEGYSVCYNNLDYDLLMKKIEDLLNR